jgi:hypothetical protein
MKILNEEKEVKEFKPFAINLLIETEGEARLLWHVFNRLNLKEAIFHSGYDTVRRYIQEMDEEFDCEKIRELINDKIII